jgi:very-short-patch-repair endonuclease
MISTAQAHAAGLSNGQIAQLVRSGQWRRCCRGAYLVPAAHPVRGPVRAALLGRPDAVVCGITAAHLLRFEVPGTMVPGPAAPCHRVHLLLPPNRTRAQPSGVILHFGALSADHVITVANIPVTSPDRTLADLVLCRGRDDAVAVMDTALRMGHVNDLVMARSLAYGRHGADGRRGWWRLADGRAESPLETRLRLLFLDAGLPPAHPQWPVTDAAGRIVARLDLAWPGYRLDVEADGVGVHGAPAALYADRQRQNLLAGLGWTVLRFTWEDLRERSGEVARVVAAALRTAGWDGRADRRQDPELV